jgi:hypothetical protein
MSNLLITNTGVWPDMFVFSVLKGLRVDCVDDGTSLTRLLANDGKPPQRACSRGIFLD